MSSFIRWCECKRRILTTKQIERNQKCNLCQQEHAIKFQEDNKIEKDEEELIS